MAIDESWEEEKNLYEILFYSLFERKTKIIDIKKKEDGIGFTSDDGNIHLARTNPLFSNFKKENKAFFRKGVFAHEMLHQFFTDFAYMNKILKSDKYTQKEKEIIFSFANLVEDPAIEYFAPSAFGGTLVDALNFTITTIYKKSPTVDSYESSFAQLQQALIHFGDMGIVKGKFTSAEAQEAFRKIAPEFYKTIFEPKSSKRIDMAIKWMEDTRKFWDYGNIGAVKAEINLIMENNFIESFVGEKQQLKMPTKGQNGGVTERRENFISALVENEESVIEDFFKESSDANKIAKINGVKSTFKRSEAKPKEIEVVYDDEMHPAINQRIKSNDINLYSAYVKENEEQIKLLTNSLKQIFKEDTGEILRKTSGKYNVKRGAVNTTANVFDKRIAPIGLKDMAVFLLVDESGSMCGYKEVVAMKTAIILAEVFSNLDIPYYIMGFTADKIDSYQHATHDHFVTWQNLKSERVSLIKIKGQANNNDAFSITYASEALRKIKAEHKLLLILTDGMPMAWGCMGPEGVKKTAEAVKRAKRHCSVEAVGIRIKERDEENMKNIYGKNYTNVDVIDQLAPILAKQMKKAIRSWQ